MASMQLSWRLAIIGIVWPRFDQRVVVNDSGIAAYYGSHEGVLELTSEGATAIYGELRIPLPTQNSEREDYLRAVIKADSNNAELKARLASMLAAQTQPADVAADEAEMPQLAELARTGLRGVAHVESLVASTVAGIRVLAEGRVPPPASFLEDFGAQRAGEGGIFAAVRASV